MRKPSMILDQGTTSAPESRATACRPSGRSSTRARPGRRASPNTQRPSTRSSGPKLSLTRSHSARTSVPFRRVVPVRSGGVLHEPCGRLRQYLPAVPRPQRVVEELDLDGSGVPGRLHVSLPLPHVARSVPDLSAAGKHALRPRRGPVGELAAVDTAARTRAGDLRGRVVVPPDVVRVDGDA